MYRDKKNVRDIDLMYSGTERPKPEELEEVKSVSQRPWKPEGGLWTSPRDPSGNGEAVWQTWCKEENYHTEYYQQHWHIVPHEDCNILVVDEDLANVKEYMLSVENDAYSKGLDYEKIAEKYDAVYFPESTVWAHNSDYLRAFDVESCLFLRGKYDVMDDEEYKTFKMEKNKKLIEESLERIGWEVNNPRQAILREIKGNRSFNYHPRMAESQENSVKVNNEEERIPPKTETQCNEDKKDGNTTDKTEKIELSDKEKKKRAMLRRIAKLNISNEKGVVNPKRTKLEKAYLVMIDRLKNR